MTKKIGIYLHIPFCLSKCHYCDFCSTPRADDQKKQLYVDALCREIGAVAAKIREKHGRVPVADTVYFGGGTPSLLYPAQLDNVVSAIDHNFGITSKAEITVEVNPKTADMSKLVQMRYIGINRLSIGMQSANDKELRALGRMHCFEDFVKCYLDARDAKFNNISVDLMYGIPEQTMDSFKSSIKELCDLEPEHISSYCLAIEEGTNFYRRRNKLILPDEDTVSDMYLEMSNILAERGYNKYEISNFSRKGKESRHNIKYWRREEYLGFGAGAHSFFDGVRQAHSYDIDRYISGESILEEAEIIDAAGAEEEFFFLNMRLARGVDIAGFERLFGVDFNEKYGKGLKKYSPEYVIFEGDRCRFTDKGMLISNHILADVL